MDKFWYNYFLKFICVYPIYLVQKSAYCIVLIYCGFDLKILNSFVIVCSINVGITSILFHLDHLITCNFHYLNTEGEALFAHA